MNFLYFSYSELTCYHELCLPLHLLTVLTSKILLNMSDFLKFLIAVRSKNNYGNKYLIIYYFPMNFNLFFNLGVNLGQTWFFLPTTWTKSKENIKFFQEACSVDSRPQPSFKLEKSIVE